MDNDATSCERFDLSLYFITSDILGQSNYYSRRVKRIKSCRTIAIQEYDKVEEQARVIVAGFKEEYQLFEMLKMETSMVSSKYWASYWGRFDTSSLVK